MSIFCYNLFMPKIYGLDIPPGLEEWFFKIMQFGNSSDQSNLVLKTAKPTRQRKARWNIQSLFVRWQSLYDGFDSTRKSAWTSYWSTLPFGSHVGAGGWPGSGYSAFVYVNAPLFRN